MSVRIESMCCQLVVLAALHAFLDTKANQSPNIIKIMYHQDCEWWVWYRLQKFEKQLRHNGSPWIK